MSDPRTVTLADIEAMDGPTYSQFKKDLGSKRVAIDANIEANPVETSDADRLAAGEWTDDEVKAATDAQESRHITRRSQATLAHFEDAEQEDRNRYGNTSPNVMSVRDRIVNAIANSETDAEKAPLKEALAYLRGKAE